LPFFDVIFRVLVPFNVTSDLEKITASTFVSPSASKVPFTLRVDALPFVVIKILSAVFTYTAAFDSLVIVTPSKTS